MRRGGRGAVPRAGGWKEVTGCGSGDAAAGSCRSKDGVGSHLPTPGRDLGTEQGPKWWLEPKILGRAAGV